ncbi:MAG: hypothetical protein JWL74_1779 [Alphaproteobacteria bacterium]|nr:hypothetical protein [Alphaproteobacteria bacterium]
MLLLALALTFAQTAPGPGAAKPRPISHVVLGDDSRRPRLERLLADLARTGFDSKAAAGSGMAYVACVGAWADNSTQGAACIQSILSRGGDHTVVLNSYERPARGGETMVSCIGSGGRGLMRLRARPDPGEGAALRACLETAARPSPAVPRGIHRVRSSDELPVPVARARAAAASVLKIAVDHVGIPRGTRGICLVQGRVLAAARGAGLAPGEWIELGIPCIAGRDRNGSRRIAMGDMRRGSFAHIYLDEHRTLLDFEPATR